MSTNQRNTDPVKWVRLVLGLSLLASFFLPWVIWKDSEVSGYHLPAGKFFSVAETKFGLGNPFPQLDFTFYAFWLIPLLAVIIVTMALANRKNPWPAFVGGAISLSLVTIYYLFSTKLIDLGVGSNVFDMLKIPFYIHALSAIGLILTAAPVKSKWLPLLFLLAGPVIAFGGYKLVEKKVMNESFADTDQLKADYTVNALDLLREYAENDSSANRKYREKIMVVKGIVSKAETMGDSTVNIQFADSTGSYIIFSFDKNQYPEVKDIKTGDSVSAKGSCSGSIYSEILGTRSISFKRTTITQ